MAGPRRPKALPALNRLRCDLSVAAHALGAGRRHSALACSRWDLRARGSEGPSDMTVADFLDAAPFAVDDHDIVDAQRLRKHDSAARRSPPGLRGTVPPVEFRYELPDAPREGATPCDAVYRVAKARRIEVEF
jgi:hypothetical protein